MYVEWAKKGMFKLSYENIIEAEAVPFIPTLTVLHLFCEEVFGMFNLILLPVEASPARLLLIKKSLWNYGLYKTVITLCK